jgi:hypothetical protein
MPVEMTRADFLQETWDYWPGEHVLIIAPTGAGKSYLAWQLIDGALQMNPSLRFVSFMPKSADSTTSRNAQSLNLKETPVWPPKRKFWEPKPRGYVLWPPHNYGPDSDTMTRRAQIGRTLNKGLESQLVSGNSLSFVDDAHSAAAMMDLNPLIEETLTNGRAGGSGLWLATQKPSGTRVSGGLTTFAYNSATHMFFSRDNDDRNLDRLTEIGSGTDPKEMAGWIKNLRTWPLGPNGEDVGEFLYMDRAGSGCRILPWL